MRKKGPGNTSSSRNAMRYPTSNDHFVHFMWVENPGLARRATHWFKRGASRGRDFLGKCVVRASTVDLTNVNNKEEKHKEKKTNKKKKKKKKTKKDLTFFTKRTKLKKFKKLIKFKIVRKS